MAIRIIADSSCDTTQSIREQVNPLFAPLTVEVIDVKSYLDDGTVDIEELIEAMQHAPNGLRSSCPSPAAYQEFMLQCDECFVITLSSKLSGSYNAACLAREMVLEEHPEKKIHIIDSKSASSGEVQILLKLHALIEQGLTFEEITPVIEEYRDSLTTMFVLEDLGNLFRGGRLKKVAGIVASKIKLCPIMSDDGNGNIKFVAPSLGMKHALRKLVDVVAEKTSQAKEQSLRLVLCFCNCADRAQSLAANFLKKCPAIKEVISIPTGALSSMYANNGGIIIAF